MTPALTSIRTRLSAGPHTKSISGRDNGHFPGTCFRAHFWTRKGGHKRKNALWELPACHRNRAQNRDRFRPLFHPRIAHREGQNLAPQVPALALEASRRRTCCALGSRYRRSSRSTVRDAKMSNVRAQFSGSSQPSKTKRVVHSLVSTLKCSRPACTPRFRTSISTSTSRVLLSAHGHRR